MQMVSYINPSSTPTAPSRSARHGGYRNCVEWKVVHPVSFNITLARTYRWQTENPSDQADFLVSIIRLFRNITGGSIPLQVLGMRDPDSASSSRAPASAQQPFTGGIRMERAPTPPTGAPLTPAPRRPYANGYNESPSKNRESNFSARSASPAPSSVAPPTPRTMSRSRRPPSPATRAESPPVPPIAIPERSGTPSRNRPSTPSAASQAPPSALRPRQGRRPSNASTTVRSSAATSSSQIPSIVTPSSPSSSRPSIVSMTSGNNSFIHFNYSCSLFEGKRDLRSGNPRLFQTEHTRHHNSQHPPCLHIPLRIRVRIHRDFNSHHPHNHRALDEVPHHKPSLLQHNHDESRMLECPSTILKIKQRLIVCFQAMCYCP
ncbi:hypothetical protein QCA50_002508 [Cerrena zonata]|uniref:Exocyst complex component Sec3 PIP2-binding N-terminal domain-containing protein n=1 Tax=Cerrena zonata TaxID=2478898 RepID=A0AAW0GPI9_9APHY